MMSIYFLQNLLFYSFINDVLKKDECKVQKNLDGL